MVWPLSSSLRRTLPTWLWWTCRCRAWTASPLAGRTALEMQHRVRDLPAGFPDMASLSLGVGLHSGEAIVGNIGSEKLMGYTGVGGTVKVAKRLQERALGGQ